VGWVVWRRSYLNRNASVAPSGLGPSESVEAQGGECARLQSLMTRNAGDRYIVIHDGKATNFCRSCRFIRLFIAHLPPFFLTSIILVQFFFFSPLNINICFPHVYCLFFTYFLILLLLQRNAPTPQISFTFAVITDEQRFMPPSVLAWFDPTVIFSANV